MNEVSRSPAREDAPLLGQLLIEQGLIDERQLQHALAMQQRLGGSLGTVLLEKGAIAEDKLLAILGLQLQMPTVSAPEMVEIPADVLNLMPARLAQRYNVLPLDRSDDVLHVATLHPSTLHVVEDEIRSFTSCQLRPYIGIDFRVREAIQHHYGGRENLRLRALARRLGQLASGQARAATAGPRSPLGPDEGSRVDTGIAPRPFTPPPTDAASPEAASERPEPEADVDRLVRLVDRISGTEARAPAEEVVSDSATAEGRDGRDEHTTQAVERLEPTRIDDRFAGLEMPGSRPDTHAEEDDTAPLRSTDPAERLGEVATLLQQAELRDDVVAAMLDFCGPFFARRILFARRRQQIVGWKGAGEWLDRSALSRFVLDTTESSVFSSLESEGALYSGPLAPLPAHRALDPLFCGVEPQECLLIPIRLSTKTLCYLWGDNGPGGVKGAPLAQLRELATKAGYALEICILRNRI